MAITRKKQFTLLLWKNFKLILRHSFLLAINIIVASVLLVVVFINRVGITPNRSDKPLKFNPVTITELRPIKDWSNGVTKGISYCPDNKYLGNIVKHAAAKLNLPVLALPTETLLERHILKNITVAGIVFEDKLRDIDDYPKHLSYKLRFISKSIGGKYFHNSINWMTRKIYPEIIGSGPEHSAKDDGGDRPPYISNNFLQIQHALFLAFMEVIPRSVFNDTKKIPEIVMKRFPYPPYTEDRMWIQMPLCMYLIIFLFACPSAYLTTFITVEKKKQFKVVAAIIGVPNWLHWMAWYTTGIIFFAFFAIALLITFKITWNDHAIISHTATSVLLVFFFGYIIAHVAFSFMFGLFFSNPTIAYIMALLVHGLMSPVIFMYLSQQYRIWKFWQLVLLSLFMNFAVGFGMREMAHYEISTDGLHLRSMCEDSLHGEFCFGYALIMLFVDALLYVVIGLYVEQLMLPYPRNWYFPLSIFGLRDHNTIDIEANKDHHQLDGIQQEVEEKNAGVEVVNLHTKINDNIVIKGIYMKAYEGEITAILGHLGAGKSAFVAVLTGVLPPTEGTVFINRFDIRFNKRSARRRIGYCPDNNMLLSELTVREHIEFYSKLKGHSKDETRRETLKYARALGLERNLQTRCEKLSMTERKKVILCTALCGGSRVIICDEPTKDLDPTSRQIMWNLLRTERRDKTIIIMSNSIREINIFADRIGIIIKGKLKGYGDLDFLRTELGGGYMLVCVKDDFCITHKVTEFIRSHVPEIQLVEETATELVYRVLGKDMSILGKIILDISNEVAELKVKNCFLHLQTAEEIMLSSARDPQEISKPLLFPKLELIQGYSLKLRQWRAMLFKKLVFTVSRFWMFAAGVLLLCIIHAWAHYILKTLFIEQPFIISLKSYPSGAVVIQSRNNSDITPIEKTIISAYGIYRKESIDLSVKYVDIEEYILKRTTEKLGLINRYYLAGATVNQNQITAWFNNEIYHTAPLSLNLVHNAILRAFTNNTCQISITNAPLPPHFGDQLNTIKGTNWGAFYTLTLSFITPLCVVEILIERTTGYKTFQLNTGLSRCIYWASSMLWDYFIFLAIALIMIVSITATLFYSPYVMSMFGIMFVAFMVYGFAAITSTYFFSCFFSQPQKAYAYLCAFNIVTGFAVIALDISLQRTDILRTLNWILLIFPHFSSAQALTCVFEVTMVRDLCSRICKELSICDNKCSRFPSCCGDGVNYFSFAHRGIAWEFLYMISVGIICLILFSIFEGGGFSWSPFRTFKENHSNLHIDNTAMEEKLRVAQMSYSQKQKHAVVFDNVLKSFNKFTALNHISVAVHWGETFGIVGPSGSGKTTIIKLLTGAEKLTHGEMYIMGAETEEYSPSLVNNLGYCPEEDGLVGYLTGRDALHICCLLRGIKNQDIESTYSKAAKFLNIKQILDTEIRYYNGSSKRKLSVAMAVLGNVDLIFLDNPTCGCEPGGVHKIWDFIENLRNAGKTIIMTTHSINEAVILCSRIAMLVNGELISVSEPSVLKASIENGINVVVKFVDNSIDPGMTELRKTMTKIKRLIERSFPDAVLKSEWHALVEYMILEEKGNDWTRLIRILEKSKRLHDIEKYEISEINIDFVFADFAHRQHRIRRGKKKLTRK